MKRVRFQVGACLQAIRRSAARRSAVSLTALLGQHGQAARATLCAFAFVLGSVAFAAAPAPVAADDAKIIFPGASANTGTPAASGGLGSITLIVGLALAGVGGWLVWRNRNGTPISRDARLLSIQETRSLGNRQYLVVAAYDDKKFLLGVTPGRIEMLTPLADSADDEDSRA